MKHKSRYTDKLITDAQYLAEIMCERKAARENIQLCFQFWNKERWIREYKTQLRFANQLLKIYSFEAIILALKTFVGKRIYSLSAKWIDPIIKEEQIKIEARKKTEQSIKKELEILKVPEKRKPFGISEGDKLG